MNFWGKKGKKGGGGHGGGHGGGGHGGGHGAPTEEETEKMLGGKGSDLGTEHTRTESSAGGDDGADIELGPVKSRTKTIS